jgi:hypothetical protein
VKAPEAASPGVLRFHCSTRQSKPHFKLCLPVSLGERSSVRMLVIQSSW